MESTLCWLAIPEYGVCPGVWLTYPVTLHWRKLAFPFTSRYSWQTASWLWVGLCIHSPFSALGSWLVWIRVGPVLAVRGCEFMCAPVLLCLQFCSLGVIHHLWLLQSFHLLFHKDPRAFCYKHSIWSFMLRVSHCLHMVQCGSWLNCCLMEKEASLIKVEQCYTLSP